jgi:pimeloyl-ACP methyl ester carboxylesterase
MTMNPKKHRGLLFWIFAILLWVPGLLFVLVSVVLMIYTFWPTQIDVRQNQMIDAEAEHVVIISHGLRDNPTTWSDNLKQTLNAHPDKQQIIALDWNPYAQSTLRCSVDGRRLGAALGEQLALNQRLRSIHLIAHSCGSFVSLGVCEALRAHRADVTIQSTFLDPVTVYGGVFWNFGAERFGDCADFSDVYIDTEDEVPGSNQLIPHSHTFDVTEVRKKAGFQGRPHIWPTVFYQQLAQRGRILDLRSDSSLAEKYPPGMLEAVDSNLNLRPKQSP